jgi:hypothetical protein
LYFFSNIDTKNLVSFKVKELVASFKPLFLIHPPSSIIQIAKANGDKYSSIKAGTIFLPTCSGDEVG